MSFPGVPIIRVGYLAPRLPYAVAVNLPPAGGPDTRTEIRTTGPYLDIAVPQDSVRHERLGLFLEAWGSLESTLEYLLKELTSIELGDAGLILPKLGTRNAIEVLDGFGMRKLDAASADKLSSLLERVGKLNSKRNILVHGQWVLEANVLLRKGDAYLATQFLREVTPSDPEQAKAMGNPRNQKERVRYTFTIKRIEATTRDTDTLNRDICDFFTNIRYKELPLDEMLQKLLLARPYRVTYST
jgi:hypothetical protein